jgi:hypothetical protein
MLVWNRVGSCLLWREVEPGEEKKFVYMHREDYSGDPPIVTGVLRPMMIRLDLGVFLQGLTGSPPKHSEDKQMSPYESIRHCTYGK